MSTEAVLLFLWPVSRADLLSSPARGETTKRIQRKPTLKKPAEKTFLFSRESPRQDGPAWRVPDGSSRCPKERAPLGDRHFSRSGVLPARPV